MATTELHVQACMWKYGDVSFPALFMEGEAPDRSNGGAMLPDALLRVVLARGLRLTTDLQRLAVTPMRGWRVLVDNAGAVTMTWPRPRPLLLNAPLVLPNGWLRHAIEREVVLLFVGCGLGLHEHAEDGLAQPVERAPQLAEMGMLASGAVGTTASAGRLSAPDTRIAGAPVPRPRTSDDRPRELDHRLEPVSGRRGGRLAPVKVRSFQSQGPMNTDLLRSKLRMFFSFVDEDGYGYIEEDDLLAFGGTVVQGFGLADDSDQARAVHLGFRRLWKALADNLDADQDGRIATDELCSGMLSAFTDEAAYESLLQPAVDAILGLGEAADTFRSLDVDRGGYSPHALRW